MVNALRKDINRLESVMITDALSVYRLREQQLELGRQVQEALVSVASAMAQIEQTLLAT